jgi:hypothetical protein
MSSQISLVAELIFQPSDLKRLKHPANASNHILVELPVHAIRVDVRKSALY